MKAVHEAAEAEESAVVAAGVDVVVQGDKMLAGPAQDFGKIEQVPTGSGEPIQGDDNERFVTRQGVDRREEAWAQHLAGGSVIQVDHETARLVEDLPLSVEVAWVGNGAGVTDHEPVAYWA
jgi:hypothetical protein